MEFLLGSILVMLVGIGLVIGSILYWSNWLAHRHITTRFRDAEFILQHHRAPESWIKRGSGMGQRVGEPRRDILARLDELITFFESCPFFDGEETRQLLLSQLRQEREQWKARPDEAWLLRHG
ncbi:hypothetical protein FKZ61_009180 [Litorilinea aerophila]|uniref:Uncharacterized protein n=1 Tax=Litorilinea aerophila TaxID=1204385 RepID=A0A540VHI5_9CHLR|nr:hypothetical protein [Litorilinea aerophila]MCC9076282.1 hypothetical protein [Litorilinea aerophila]GIV80024.1 MAG: hypothetical protein KatS3mg050_4418 [Litorilinea sp.]